MLRLQEPDVQRNLWLTVLSVAMTIALGMITALGNNTSGFAIIFALAILIVTLRKPTWLFTFAYPLLIVVGKIPLSLGGITFSFERALVVAGIIGILGGVLITKNLTFQSVPKSFALGILLWFSFYVIAWVISPSDLGFLTVTGYLQKILLAYLVILSLRQWGQFYTVLQLILISSFVASLATLIAFWQEGTLYYIRESSYGVGDTTQESLFRGLARTGAGNTMALWIAILFLWQARGRKNRFFWLAVVLWFGVLSLFALRRETLITIFIGVAFISWHKSIGQRSQAILVGMVLLGLISSVGFVSEDWSHRLFVETAEDVSSGTDPRITLLVNFTPAAVLASPFVGYGPEKYADAQLHFPETVTPEIIRRGGISAHNAWSAAAVEAGVGALLSLCLFLYGLGRPLWKSRKTGNPKLDALWAFAPLIFIDLLLTLFFGTGLTLSSVWFWFGFLIALTQITNPVNTKGEVYLANAIRH